MYRNNHIGPRKRLLRIYRPKACQPIVVQPSVDDPSYFTIHRFEGRTIPCLGERCLFCDRPMPVENRIFLPGHVASAGCAGIVDLPFSHIGTLNDLANKYHTLRACMLQIVRMEPRNNAPIQVRHRALNADEQPTKPFGDLSGMLDEIFASNCEYALFALAGEKSASEDRPYSTIGGGRDV